VAILQHNGSKTPTLLAIYLGAAALLTLIAVLTARETLGTDLAANVIPDHAVATAHPTSRAVPASAPSPEPTT
jgi:hypothetical protein